RGMEAATPRRDRVARGLVRRVARRFSRVSRGPHRRPRHRSDRRLAGARAIWRAERAPGSRVIGPYTSAMQPPHFDPARIARALDAAGRRFGPDEHARLAEYLNLLVKWNAAYNLTGIRDPDALVDRHLVESLELAPLLRGTRIADVGTGAGLPGIPLAIVAPDRHFVLIEIRAKRVRFLRHVVATLGIRNAEIAHTRVEDLRCEHAFDTVLARAVDRKSVV